MVETVAAEGHEVDRPRHVVDRPGRLPGHGAARGRRGAHGAADRAILVCGSGAGVAVAACKFPNVRAVVAHDTYTAHQSVEHDDCNVLASAGA